MNDKQKTEAETIRNEAKGQFAKPKHGGKNDGVASAAPEVITGAEDATFDTDPGRKPLGTEKKIKPEK